MLRTFFKILVSLILFLSLTVVTQVGGIILLLAWLLGFFVRTYFKSTVVRRLISPALFILLYLLFTGVIIPPIAKHFGREPLPWRGNLQPRTVWTCLLNRHYVVPTLKGLVTTASDKIMEEYPGRRVNYLDANFPFFNEFPLWPHLSHDDGRKLDIAFFYMDKNGQPTSGTPSFMGYGVYEGPLESEENYPERCRDKGFWQYNLLEKFVPQGARNDYRFDDEVTAKFVKLLVKDNHTEKLFIEPHLRKRLKLNSPKIRFHGCQAVRHDDHVHVQVK